MAKAKTQKFPKTVYVRMDPEFGAIADESIEALVHDDDAVVDIAVYEFVCSRRYERVITEVAA